MGACTRMLVLLFQIFYRMKNFFPSDVKGTRSPTVDWQYSSNKNVKREGQGGLYVTPTGNEFHDSVSMLFAQKPKEPSLSAPPHLRQLSTLKTYKRNTEINYGLNTP